MLCYFVKTLKLMNANLSNFFYKVICNNIYKNLFIYIFRNVVNKSNHITISFNLARYFHPENRNYQPIPQSSSNQIATISGGNQATATSSGNQATSYQERSSGNQATSNQETGLQATRNAADIHQGIQEEGIQVVEEGFNRPSQENSPGVNLPSQEGDDLRFVILSTKSFKKAEFSSKFCV